MSALFNPQVSENDIANLQGLIAATKDDEAYYLAAIAAATVNLASKTVAVYQQGNAAGASTPTAGFSAGLSLDIKGSQSDTSSTATKSNASNLTASNINIATDNTKDTSVTVSGSNVNATDTLNIDTHDLNVIASTIDVNAQRDVNILSATESASHEHKESTAKAGIGVTLNMNEASIFAGVITKSDKIGEGQTQEVSSQLVGDNITVHSGNNTNVLASNVIANNDVSIQADNNINILSEDRRNEKNEWMNYRFLLY